MGGGTYGVGVAAGLARCPKAGQSPKPQGGRALNGLEGISGLVEGPILFGRFWTGVHLACHTMAYAHALPSARGHTVKYRPALPHPVTSA